MQPILVRPECSASAVVAAAFHPERASYFLLAFADGTAAVFDAAHFFPKHAKREHGMKTAIVGTGGILAFMRRLHVQGTGISSDRDGLDGSDIGKFITGRGRSCYITAVTFVPGRKATVITVGADGRCCIVDFTQDTKRKAVLLKSWHLRRPGTSLSVIHYGQDSRSSQIDGPSNVDIPNFNGIPDEAYCIAIGREDGRVLLFDLSGRHLGDRMLNYEGAPIVDVEWVLAESSGVSTHRGKSSPPFQENMDIDIHTGYPRPVEARVRHDSLLQPIVPPELSKLDGQSRTLVNPSCPQEKLLLSTQDLRPKESTTAANHLNLIEALPTSSEEASSGDTIAEFSDSVSTTSPDKNIQKETGLSSLRPSPIASNNMSSRKSAVPPIPPRPNPRPGGLLSKRRAQSSYGSVSDDSYSTFIASARRTKSNLPSRPGGFFGPRPMPTREGHSPKRSATSAGQPFSEHMEALPPSEVPPAPPPHRTNALRKFPTASIESVQTASSQVNSLGLSERSTDTVIDWDVGQTRQPFPSLNEEQYPAIDNVSQIEPEKKGHISLSVSSVSRDTLAPTSSAASNETSPVGRWAERSPPYSAPSLHATQRPTESPAGPKTNQKGHVSIPVSSASIMSTTSASPASSGAIIQWPSLKKSPRIPELNKALLFSGGDSIARQRLDASSGARSSQEARSAISQGVGKAVARSQSSTNSSKIESALNAALSGFRIEMAQKFEDQRMWLEELIRNEDEGRILLEEENRWLRAELDKFRGEV